MRGIHRIIDIKTKTDALIKHIDVGDMSAEQVAKNIKDMLRASPRLTLNSINMPDGLTAADWIKEWIDLRKEMKDGK